MVPGREDWACQAENDYQQSGGKAECFHAKDVYIRTLDLSKALAENKRLSDLEEQLEAEKRRKAEREAERKRLEEERKAEEERQRAEAEKEALATAAAGISSVEAQEAVAKMAGAGSEVSKIGAESAESVSEPPESGAETPENVSVPVTPMGRTIESVESQAFAAAVDPFAPKEEEKKFRTRFCAVGTRAQLQGLIQYMQDNGIEYGRIR